MNKTIRYAIYGVIVVLCVIAIIVGVYTSIHVDYENTVISQNTIIDEKSSEDIDVIDDDSFKKLFYNSLDAKGYDVSAIKKIDNDEHKDEIVYSYNVPKDGTIGNVVIPAINIDTEEAKKLNDRTSNYISFMKQFSAEAKASKESANFEVGYAAYIYNDILSIAIRCSYKLGNDTQTIDIQTYNYDLINNKLVTMDDIINKYSLDVASTEGKISAIINRKNQSSKDVVESGYNGLYIRDISDDMYKLENSDNFLLTDNGEIYIVYTYAAKTKTATYDVVKAELPKK